MVEPITTAVLATAAVKVAGEFLAKAAEGSATKLGEATTEAAGHGAATLWQKLKSTLAHRGAGRAVERLEAKPEDQRIRDALVLDVADALEAEPDFRTQVQAVVDQLGGVRNIVSQASTQTGDGNANTQIVGSGNVVSSHHRPET